MVDVHAHLGRALIARGGGMTMIVRGDMQPWASVTFTGARHRLTLSAPEDAAMRLVDGLEEHQFAIPGHVVADISIVERTYCVGETVVEIEALTIQDA